MGRRLVAAVGGIVLLAGVLVTVGAPPAGAVPDTCALKASAPQPSEGPTDALLYQPSTGTSNAVMLFVDFADAPASETTSDLHDDLVPWTQSWLDDVSYGLASLSVTPVHTWFRMPQDSSLYGFADGVTFEEQQTFFEDAVAEADATTNFSGYTQLFVVTSAGADIPFSPPFSAFPGDGILADGNELRAGVTLGDDIRFASTDYGAHILAHETVHTLGLPDLYDFFGATFDDTHRFVGAWDHMGWIGPGAPLMAWQKRKLGWLAADQFTCLSSSATVTLTPLETPGGLKAVAVRQSQTRVLVLENRQPVGQDAARCDSGVLAYTVDSAIATGAGPIRVIPARSDSNAGLRFACGRRYNAPFDVGTGNTATFTDTATGVAVTVLSRAANGNMDVSVTFPSRPTLTVSDVTVNEGPTATTAVFTVSLSAPTTRAVSFRYATAPGMATTADYAHKTNVATIPAGSTSKTVSVTVKADLLDEANEQFNLIVSNVANAVVGDDTGTATIIDDDPPPAMSIGNVSVFEGGTGVTTPARFTVSLSAKSGRTVTATFATANGTATAGSDYVARTGTVTIQPGRLTATVTVNVKGDAAVEPNEQFVMNLSAPSAATISDGQGAGTIRNDDSFPS